MIKKKKTLIIIGSIVLSVILLFVILVNIETTFDGDPVERFILFVTRPSEGTQTPDFSQDVTDVRITTVDRNIGWMPTIIKNEVFRTRVFKQIYYGYYSNNAWCDIPCENYELRALGSTQNRYDAADGRHVVKIGSYVLLAFPVAVTSDSESYGVVTDSLKSQIIELTEYATSGLSMPDSNKKCYGSIREDYRTFGSFGFEHEITNAFYKWYYIILEYDNIPKNYQVSITQYSSSEDTEPIVYSYSYEDIIEALNRE